MSEPFSLPQVKFASFQFVRLFCDLSLSTFSVFDIEARAEPFRDVPVLITKGHFSMQKRTISSVRAPNTRFYFEWFAASQSRVPFLNYRSYVFRMNRFGPAPPANVFEWFTKKIQPSPIKIIDVPVGPSSMNKRGS